VSSLSKQTANNNNSNLTLLLAGLLSAGALLIVVAIILLVVLLRKKRNKRNGDEHHNGSHQMALTDTDIVAIETNLNEVTSDETTATTLPPYQQGTETRRGLSPGRIPMNELEIGREIGQGTYGRVCVGKWKKYRVALKFCQNKGKMEEFMREANLMISLPPHPNVVRMYGVSIDGTQPIIVMEYCAGGSLDKVLFDEKQQISLEQKIKWVQEIAEGVKHLHKHNIVHRDLAARNILLSYRNSNDAQLKISDFGMSRVLQQDIEAKTMNPIGPIRWMAPESIKQQVYSKKSDVWMFGILVYEIVAQSEPHVNIEPQKILVFIRDKGFTPIIPSNCPVKLRELMELCWNKQPEQRPVSSKKQLLFSPLKNGVFFLFSSFN
jgi:serine/threonine protein kinase